jgi:glutamine synthetase adenylyltransferase
MKTALMPEPPINNIPDLKEWLKVEYDDLRKIENIFELNHNPQAHNIHARKRELIKVGEAIGLELNQFPSLDEGE